MKITHNELLRGILIGSSLFLCSSILIVALYLLYRHRRKSILNNIQKDIDRKSVKHISSLPNLIKHEEETIVDPLIHLNNERRSTNHGTTIQELMRKSLQLAKTVEKVADEKEKRISLKDKLHIDIQLTNQQ